jgi:hypothetical protein
MKAVAAARSQQTRANLDVRSTGQARQAHGHCPRGGGPQKQRQRDQHELQDAQHATQTRPLGVRVHVRLPHPVP